jgi:hypothetical protein
MNSLAKPDSSFVAAPQTGAWRMFSSNASVD